MLVACFTLSSQLMLKKGMSGAGSVGNVVAALRFAVTSPAVLIGIVLQGCSFSLWLFILTRTKLGYALGFVGAFFYLLLPLLSWWLFGERLSPTHWLGLVFLCLAVLCLGTKG